MHNVFQYVIINSGVVKLFISIIFSEGERQYKQQNAQYLKAPIVMEYFGEQSLCFLLSADDESVIF